MSHCNEAPAEADDEDEPFDHGGCYQPHRGPDGDYYDCDGRPL